MKTPILALVAISLLAIGCGTQDKGDDPFSKKKQGQGNGTKDKMTEAEFKKACEAKNGSVVGSKCKATTHAIRLTQAQVDELFKDGKSTVVIEVGKIRGVSRLFGAKKGGRDVKLLVNNNDDIGSIIEEPGKEWPAAGREGMLTLILDYGVYEYVNFFVQDCFTREVTNANCD